MGNIIYHVLFYPWVLAKKGNLFNPNIIYHFYKQSYSKSHPLWSVRLYGVYCLIYEYLPCNNCRVMLLFFSQGRFPPQIGINLSWIYKKFFGIGSGKWGVHAWVRVGAGGLIYHSLTFPCIHAKTKTLCLSNVKVF